MSQRDKLPRKPPVPKRSEMPPSILKPAASAAAAADNNAASVPTGRLGRNVSPLPSFAHVTARVDSGRGTATPMPTPPAAAALPKQAGMLRPRSNSSTASGPRSGIGAMPPAAKSAVSSITPALRTANAGGGSKNATPLAQQRPAVNSQAPSSAGNNSNKENASQPQHFLGTPRNSSPRKSNVLRHSASWSALIHEESDDDDDEFLMPEQQLSSGNTLLAGRSSQQLFLQQDADDGPVTSFADLVAASEQQQQQQQQQQEQQQASENGAAPQPRGSLRAFLGSMFSAFAQKETTVASPPRPPVAVGTSVAAAAASVVNSHSAVNVSSSATPPLALVALKGDSQPQLSATRHGSASPTTKRRLSVRFDEKVVETVVSQNPSATATRDTSPNSHASAAASKRLLELSAATAEEDADENDDDDSRRMRAADMSVVGGVTPATARRAAPPNTPADGMPTAQREQHMRQAETRNSWFSGGGGGMLAALFGNGSVSPLPPADGAVGDRNFNRQSEQQHQQQQPQEDGAAQGRSASRKIGNAAVPTSSVSSMHVAVSSTPNAAGLHEDDGDDDHDAAGGNDAESEQTEQRPAPRGSWFQRFSASLARSFSPPTRNPDNKANLEGVGGDAAASEVSVASDAVASQQQQQQQEQHSATGKKSKKSSSGKKQDADSVARVLADEASSGDDEADHFLSSSRKRSGSSSSKGSTAAAQPQRASSRAAAAQTEDGAARAKSASIFAAAAAGGDDELAAAEHNDNVDGDIPVASPPPRNPSSSSVGGKKAPSKQSAAAASPTKKKSASSLTANSKQKKPESSSSSSSEDDDDDDDEEIEDDEELPSMKWTAAQLKTLAQRKKLDVDAKATKAEILLAWSQKTGNALSAADSAAVKKSKSVQRSKSKRG